MDRESYVKSIYYIINWLVNPDGRFDDVLKQFRELCDELKICVEVQEPTRTSVMRAIVEVMAELLSRCGDINTASALSGATTVINPNVGSRQ
ncbi:hypothetical protein [Vulcanisaeta thermophila]|uniref:hypothetical protein n=1 Tax=Vulcanisaeta thermophila TaxID=867917 RepID=UPI000853C71D|nr:hypothetical protein [Vulcanisaeta thermophila]